MFYYNMDVNTRMCLIFKILLLLLISLLLVLVCYKYSDRYTNVPMNQENVDYPRTLIFIS